MYTKVLAQSTSLANLREVSLWMETYFTFNTSATSEVFKTVTCYLS